MEDLETRIKNLEETLAMFAEIVKKLNNILKMKFPSKITEGDSVLFSKNCFVKIYNKNPELFKDCEDYDTGDIEKIYKKNIGTVEFKKILYKNKYNY